MIEAEGLCKGPAHGSWERIDGRSYATTMLFFRFNPQTGAFLGTQKVNRTMRLAQDGQTFTAVSLAAQYDPNGILTSVACALPRQGSESTSSASSTSRSTFLMNEGDTLSHRSSRSNLIAVTGAMPLALLLTAATAALAQPRTESVYANGQTYQINTEAGIVFDASQGVLQHASPIYIIGFPVAAGTTGPITLPSGYQPQNNGLPSPIPYHDHVLVAAPGQPGYGAPLRVVQLRYTWAYAYSAAFVPVRSYEELVAGEAAGIFEAINPGAANPYEIWTTTVLIRPIVA